MKEAGLAGGPVKKPQQLLGGGGWGGAGGGPGVTDGDIPMDHRPTFPLRKRRISQVRQCPNSSSAFFTTLSCLSGPKTVSTPERFIHASSECLTC